MTQLDLLLESEKQGSSSPDLLAYLEKGGKEETTLAL
jgi:hypothetical protein